MACNNKKNIPEAVFYQVIMDSLQKNDIIQWMREGNIHLFSISYQEDEAKRRDSLIHIFQNDPFELVTRLLMIYQTK